MRTLFRHNASRWMGWLLILAVSAAPALAAEESAPDPADSPVGLVFRWLNFALVAGGLGYILAKFGGPYFRERAKGISQSIREAAEVRAAAEREAAQASQRLANLQNEIEGLKQAARKESAAEAERIRVLARSEAEKIAKAAQAEIAAAERAGHQELRAVAARLATERAAALLGQRLNPAAQAALFQSFVGKLGSAS